MDGLPGEGKVPKPGAGWVEVVQGTRLTRIGTFETVVVILETNPQPNTCSPVLVRASTIGLPPHNVFLAGQVFDFGK